MGRGRESSAHRKLIHWGKAQGGPTAHCLSFPCWFLLDWVFWVPKLILFCYIVWLAGWLPICLSVYVSSIHHCSICLFIIYPSLICLFIIYPSLIYHLSIIYPSLICLSSIYCWSIYHLSIINLSIYLYLSSVIYLTVIYPPIYLFYIGLLYI